MSSAQKKNVFPKKGNKRRQQQQQARKDRKTMADKLQKDSGGRGTDIRNPKREHGVVANTAMVVRGTVATIDQEAPLEANTLAILALGPILAALKKGWGARPNGNQEAYDAWVYLTEAFVSAANGTIPSLQVAPKWLWELFAMLRPKASRFKTGSINYKWQVDAGSSYVPVPELPLGPYSVFFGVNAGTGTTNGFQDIVSPPPYLPASGETAINSLFQFYPDEGHYKRIADPGDGCFLHGDVSAFQSAYNEWGATAYGPGGVAVSVLGEANVNCPMLSKFAPYQQIFWRGLQNLRKSAGTACYIGPRVAEMKTMGECKSKISPIFKFYNFDEYFLRLSYILATALELAAADTTTDFPGICTLTPWQVQMILRQTLLPRFCNEMAQDLCLSGSATLGLWPMVCGTNGVSITSEAFSGMLLPFVFAEGCRSAHRLLRDISNSKFGTSFVDVVPILARPAKADVPTLGNFQYQLPDGTYANVYSTLGGEVDVDLLDLSYGAPGKNYITANGEYLGLLISTWNDWIKKLGSHLTTLVTVGTEPGIAALCTVINTSHQRTVPPPIPVVTASPQQPQPSMVKTPSQANIAKKEFQIVNGKAVTIKGACLDRKKTSLPRPEPGSSSEFYKNVAVSSLTSTSPFYSPLTRFSRSFVHPSSIGILGEVNECTLSFQQVNQVEPNRIYFNDHFLPTTSNDGAVMVDSLAAAGAILDVKSNLAAESEAEIELKEMASKGEGGFFTSLAGMIGDAVGIPQIRAVANAVNKIVDV